MKLNKFLLLIVLISICPTMFAADFGTQNNLPIDITADSSDSTLSDGVTILKNNVHIKQGQLEITAALGKIHTSDSKVVRIDLEGSPVRWHQELPEGEILDAQANTINYQVKKALIVLTGDVEIKHPQGEIKGHEVRYNLTTERFITKSSGGNDRVHFRINPTEKAPADENKLESEPDKAAQTAVDKTGASDHKNDGDK